MSGSPPPSAAHDRLRSLLGPWLLYACSPREAADVEAHLGRCAGCAAEVRELRPAVDHLATVPLDGEPAAAPPAAPGYEPAGALAAALGRRPPAARGVPPAVRPYADQAATLDAVLRELDRADWDTETVEGWTVAQLVAHLAATDSLAAQTLGPGARAPLGDPADSIAERTHAYVTWAAGQPPDAVRTLWHTQAEDLGAVFVRRLRLEEAGEAEAVALPGSVPLSVPDHAVWRAFETWIHTRDLALRTGLRLPPPTARTLARMTEFGVRLFPLAMAIGGTPLGDRTMRVDLTGPGGGSWVIDDSGPVAGAGADSRTPAAGFALGAEEFCLLLADRLDATRAAAGARLTGDRALVAAAFAAAPAFAGP